VKLREIFFQDKEEKQKLQVIDHQAGHEVAMFAEFAQLSHN
jgi:dephospho-CoA kinase